MELIKDARAIQKVGAAMLLLEAVPPEARDFLTKDFRIPVYGIGAGPYVDGELLVVRDMLGVFQAYTPKFVKKYANLGEETLKAMEDYVREVKGGRFPTEEHTYKMITGEKEKLDKLIQEVKE